MFKLTLVGTALAILASVNLANAQQPPAMTQQSQNIKRTPLQKFEFPVPITRW